MAPEKRSAFMRKSLDDPEGFVREQLKNLRQRPKMWTCYRADFVAEVATMLWMLGVKGSFTLHFHEKNETTLLKVGAPITEDFAHQVVDEALRILDDHPAPVEPPPWSPLLPTKDGAAGYMKSHLFIAEASGDCPTCRSETTDALLHGNCGQCGSHLKVRLLDNERRPVASDQVLALFAKPPL